MANILLAEDDASLRGFLTRSLTKQGHAVTAVDDGLVALPLLRPGAFDALVADIVMPAWTGSNSPGGDRYSPRHQDHVHHRFRRGSPEGAVHPEHRRQGPVEALPPAHLVAELHRLLDG